MIDRAKVEDLSYNPHFGVQPLKFIIDIDQSNTISSVIEFKKLLF